MNNGDRLVISAVAGAGLAILAMWFGIVWIDDPAVDDKLRNTALILALATGGGLFCWLNKP